MDQELIAALACRLQQLHSALDVVAKYPDYYYESGHELMQNRQNNQKLKEGLRNTCICACLLNSRAPWTRLWPHGHSDRCRDEAKCASSTPCAFAQRSSRCSGGASQVRMLERSREVRQPRKSGEQGTQHRSACSTGSLVLRLSETGLCRAATAAAHACGYLRSLASGGE
jgi:hypothetical protein